MYAIRSYYEVCDWQPALAASVHGRHTILCRSLPEFAERIHYYLAHTEERRQLALAAHAAALETGDYTRHLAELLQDLD